MPMFSKSDPNIQTSGKKTLKEIEAELEAKSGRDDLDDAPPSVGEGEGSSTTPWKTIVSEDAPRYYR